MPDFPCLRCGSDTVVPDAIVTSNLSQDPHRIWLKREMTLKNAFTSRPYHKARAKVCGDCGFVELYAEKPGEVWDDHLTRVTER
jgi:hypothetical protein